jgi:hypothetical protein
MPAVLGLAMGHAAVANFRASLKRSERIQPPPHGPCLLSTIVPVSTAATPGRIAALVVMAPILPLSVGVIVKLNRALEDPALDGDDARTEDCLRRWGRLHRMRSTLAIIGFVLLTVPF